jgi:hypothetical protein
MGREKRLTVGGLGWVYRQWKTVLIETSRDYSGAGGRFSVRLGGCPRNVSSLFSPSIDIQQQHGSTPAPHLQAEISHRSGTESIMPRQKPRGARVGSIPTSGISKSSACRDHLFALRPEHHQRITIEPIATPSSAEDHLGHPFVARFELHLSAVATRGGLAPWPPTRLSAAGGPAGTPGSGHRSLLSERTARHGPPRRRARSARRSQSRASRTPGCSRRDIAT